ncbi:MAG: hypothetical protein A2068_00140 [Ignavibacteria bacterium GWB2_35_6b]|nr:MAG: hypothetical protein A2068_00140 [Ignavibacteria bacterium GWB2_35_6b]
MRYKYNPPLIIKKIFNNFIWETSNNKILLTFDDGPNPGTTEIILEELNNQKIKAVFFCVGNNIHKYPELAKDILANGHLIANHTYNHKIITKLPGAFAEVEIKRFNEIAEDILRFTPKYFRPPHGRFNFKTQKLMRQFKMKNVMWSLLTYDYKNDLSIVKYSVKKYLRKNSIIVLHDSLKSKDIICDSIKFIAEEAAQKGFEFGEPEECLK